MPKMGNTSQPEAKPDQQMGHVETWAGGARAITRTQKQIMKKAANSRRRRRDKATED